MLSSIKFIENSLPVSDFIKLKEEAFGRPFRMNAGLELKSSIYTIHAELNGKVVAMARIIEANSFFFHLTDIIVCPEMRNQGIGKMIMDRAIIHAKENLLTGSEKNLVLFSPKSKESFYMKFGFKSCPESSIDSGIKMYFKEK